MDILLIAVMAANGIIGRDGIIPWHIPEELGFFKATTMGHPIIMGRKTYESLPDGPLPGRDNIVITRNPAFAPPGVVVVPSLDEALAHCAGRSRVFIIGGAQVFHDALPLATGIILSILDQAVDGDTHFPAIDPRHFQEASRHRHSGGAQPFTVVTYRRITS